MTAKTVKVDPKFKCPCGEQYDATRITPATKCECGVNVYAYFWKMDVD